VVLHRIPNKTLPRSSTVGIVGECRSIVGELKNSPTIEERWRWGVPSKKLYLVASCGSCFTYAILVLMASKLNRGKQGYKKLIMGHKDIIYGARRNYAVVKFVGGSVVVVYHRYVQTV
jgi:hypothetical protein